MNLNACCAPMMTKYAIPHLRASAKQSDKTEELRDRIAASIPMGRFGRIEKVAPAFLFFASQNCGGYITGQILDIDGGQIDGGGTVGQAGGENVRSGRTRPSCFSGILIPV